MPNYYLSVLYKHIIQVENKNVGLKVGGAQTYHCPPPLPPLPTPVNIVILDYSSVNFNCVLCDFLFICIKPGCYVAIYVIFFSIVLNLDVMWQPI